MDNININTNTGNKEPENDFLKFFFYIVITLVAIFYLAPIVSTYGIIKVILIWLSCDVIKEAIQYCLG